MSRESGQDGKRGKASGDKGGADGRSKGRGVASVRPVYLVALVMIVVAGVAGVVWSITAPPVTQPIAFNHFLHVEDLGADCTDCHLYAVSGMRATIPNLQTCADCHDEPIGESPQEARLIGYVEAKEPIPWRKVYWVPEHVFFSHRRHTAVAEIACETCHGPIRDRVAPLSRPLVPISMEGCMECHAQSGVTNDCIVCHR